MDKEKLLAKRGPALRDVQVDVGTVRVRGLTRGEVVQCKDADGKTVDIDLIAQGMVDPELTKDEVAEWLSTAPAGDYVAVMEAISDLSGLSKESAKSDVPGVRRRQRR